jgi:peptidoglycan/LPS O-acetylase OafA/YrhL
MVVHVGLQSSRQNNFDLIRLLAAVAVVVGHSFVLTAAGRAPVMLGIPIHALAVAAFFSVSGYLIAGSWARAPRWNQFLWNRFLRIFPALFALVLVTTFVIGPLVTTLPMSVYFASPVTYQYLQNLTTLAVYHLPGVFQSSVHARAVVNGSLWTLGVEVACYLGVLLLGTLAFRKRTLGALFLSAAVGAALLHVLAGVGVPGVQIFHDAAPVMVYFFASSSLRMVGSPRAFPLWALATCALVWMLSAAWWPESALAVSWLALPYCVVGIGIRSTPVLCRVARFGDLSYGVYLWGFVAQQVLLDLTGRISFPSNLLLVLATTFVLATLSWHLLERRALQLKGSVPFAPWMQRVQTKIGPLLDG